jgi:NTE family protein
VNGKRIAVVVGAGSVKCAAAIGLTNVLTREGLVVDRLIGCSGGSMYAALIACGFDPATIASMTTKLWTSDVTSVKNRRAMLATLMPRWFGFNERFGMRSDKLILQRLRAVFGDRRIEDLPLPLHLTATDFHTGEQVVLSSGDLVTAIRASIAIPFFFEPVEIDGRLLLDGFLSDPLPVGVPIREGADIIIAMGFESPYQVRIDSAPRFALQISSIMTNNLLKSNFAFHNLAHHAEILPIIPQFRERIRLFDTGKIPSIIEDGERAAEAELPYLRRMLAERTEMIPA